MRILDAILAGNAPDLNKAIGLANFKREIEDMETFDINNIAEYIYGQPTREWGPSDFPCLAPPFQRFWMEHSRPSTIAASDTAPRRIAFWFTVWEPTVYCKAKELPPVENARWTLSCQTFCQLEHQSVLGPLSEHILMLNEQGATVGYTHSISDDLLDAWAPALLALSFLHCKNVSVQREEPPDPKLAKRRCERGQTPRVVFKTLNITPMKTVLEKVMAETPGGLKRALHICRGHFANYEERGLFGKLRGRFWISQHLRGDLNKGVVHKIYNVKAPAK